MSQSRYRIVEVEPRVYRVDEWKSGWFTGPRWRACNSTATGYFDGLNAAERYIESRVFTPRTIKEFNGV